MKNIWKGYSEQERIDAYRELGYVAPSLHVPASRDSDKHWNFGIAVFLTIMAFEVAWLLIYLAVNGPPIGAWGTTTMIAPLVLCIAILVVVSFVGIFNTIVSFWKEALE